MQAPRWVIEAWRHTGVALVGPLILVGVTGVVVLMGYNSNPDVAPERIAEAPLWFDVARSLHLWSSNALLAGGFLHTLWVWRDQRVAGPYRRAYLLGAFLLGSLALEHWTGHTLRWDAVGRRMAEYQTAIAGNLNVEGLQLPLHVAGLGAAALILSLLHIGLVGGGAHVRVRPAFPGGLRRLRVKLISASSLGVAIVALAALLLPASATAGSLPWPTGFFAWLADASGNAWLFAVGGALGWGLVVVQPWLVAQRWAARTTQALAILVFLATLFVR